MFDMCSIGLLRKRQRDIRILPVYAATVTHWGWLWPVKFALEGTVASGGWYIWSIKYNHGQKSHGVRSPCSFYHMQHCVTVPLAAYVTLNVTDLFLSVFVLFHVCIRVRFENIWICHPLIYNSPALHTKSYIECSLCKLIRRPEHLIGRHWSFIWWSSDEWVSQCYGIQCGRNCALFCLHDSCESMSNQPAFWTPDTCLI
jgi:hypothetical protein